MKKWKWIHKAIASCVAIVIVAVQLAVFIDHPSAVKALSPLDTIYSFAGSDLSIALDETGDNMVISGKLQADVAQKAEKISFYVVDIYESETLLDFSKREPFATMDSDISENFLCTVPMSQIGDIDSVHGQVFTSRVAAVVTTGRKEILVDHAKYLLNPEVLSENKEPYPVQESIKGVGCLIPSDLEQLGVNYTSFNLLLWSMLTVTDHGNASIPYEYEGETYYFNKDYITSVDNTLISAYKNNITMTAVVIMNNSQNANPDNPARYIAHPDAVNAQNLVGINTMDARGIQYYKAIMSFISERYSRPDGKYGRISNYVVGNEIGASSQWNYIGDKSINDYVDQYMRWVRLTDTLVRSNWAAARTYISFDINWTTKVEAENFVSFTNRDLLEKITTLSKLQGDFGWNIAFHPYPQDIKKIDTWNDPDATRSFDTKYITFKNLEVLPQYISQEFYRYNGMRRSIILSEQGFTSGDNSLESQKLQAAAYAYAFYKTVSTPGIDMLSMNGHIDNTTEDGLFLGLWTAKPGTVNMAYEKKVIYDVFKNIDTVDSLKVTQFALDIIGKTMGKTVTDWKQVIPEFDEERIRAICNRPVQQTASSGVPVSITNESVLSKGTLTCWQASDDSENLRLVTEDGRKAVLKVDAQSLLYNPDIPKDYKGMTYTPREPLDLSKSPVVIVDAKASGCEPGTVAGRDAEYILRVYSGDKVIESTPIYGATDTWQTLAIDLSGWDGAKAVDRIKVWVRNVEDVVFSTGSLSVDGLRCAKSAKISNVAVSVDGSVEKEGDAISVTITNNGNQPISGNAVFSGVNGLSFDTDSRSVNLPPLESVTIPLNVVGFDVPYGKAGGLSVVLNGKTYAFTLMPISYQDFYMQNNKVMLGTFENGCTDNWYAGEKTQLAQPVVVFQPYPTAASEGTGFMQAMRGSYVGVVPTYLDKTIYKTLNLSGYNKLKFDFMGFGGVSTSGYTITLTLTSGLGEEAVYKYDYNPAVVDVWETFEADLTGFTGRNDIRSISIGFSANNNLVYSGEWLGHFFIDNVYAERAGGAGGNPAVK